MNETFNQQIRKLPESIPPFYKALPPNTPILLHEGEMDFLDKDILGSTEEGKVYLSWSPSPDISFEIPLLQRRVPEDQSDIKYQYRILNYKAKLYFEVYRLSDRHLVKEQSQKTL